MIGIASNAYADTWAHQNFFGKDSAFNSQDRLIENLIPNIGHADAFDKPDSINLIWEDKRFKFSVNNSKRFLTAVKKLYEWWSSDTWYITLPTQ